MRRAALALLLGLVLVPAALDAAAIQGTVVNQNTRKSLERALVQVQGTSYQALTDRDGTYRISGLPAGQYTVVASYTDLEPVTRTLTVTEQDAVVDFALTSDEIYKLDSFVVTSTVEGTAFAVNQQRRAESTRSVTSVDAFIDQTTGNPGEFLKNVEGIQMEYSQNEPQTIRVRGFDPNLTTVLMDGNDIASAASSSANRAVQIDQLSIASIDSVEVYKAPIPSMSANAIGGAVNFRTKSAFEQNGRRAFIQAGVNMDSNDFNLRKSPGPGHGDKAERRVYPVGRFEYSNSFFNKRLGIMFSTGYDHTNQLGSSTAQELSYTALPGGTLPTAPTLYTLDNVVVRRSGFSIAPNRQLRVRADASLNFDYRFSPNLTGYLKTSYTYYHSTNRNHGFTLSPGKYSADSTPTSYSTADGSASQSTSIFDKYTRSSQFSPGLKYRISDWKIDLAGGYSKSVNHYENPDNFTSVNSILGSPAGWTLSGPLDSDVPTSIVQTSGPDVYNLANYRPNQSIPSGNVLLANSGYFASTNKRDTWDAKYSARLDVQRDLHLAFPMYLKAGGAYNETVFDKNQTQKRWYWAGDDGQIGTSDDNTTEAHLERFAEPVPVTAQIPGFSLREPTYLSANELWKYWQAHPQVLVENQAYSLQQQIAGRQKVNEQVRAGYAMASATFMRKLNLLAGVRVEKTNIRTQGYRVLPTSGPSSVLPAGVNANSVEGIRASYRPMTTRSNYRSDPFPYLHARYEILDGLQARASYTEAIGRPNLSDLIPNNVTQDDINHTISANRAGLLPQRSQNLDASLEYYTRSSGQWTVGWFQRDVSKYITQQTLAMTPELMTELGLGPEYATYTVNTKANLGSAKWSGYELSFRQSLRDLKFVPRLLSGVSVWANYTKIAKMEGDFGTPGAKINKLANVVPELVNAGISYRTPAGKFFIQLSTNYQAARPTQNMPATGNSAQRSPRQEKYQFWNMETSYRINDRLRFTGTGRNLFSERPRFSEMGIIRNTQQATGIAWLFAFRYDL